MSLPDRIGITGVSGYLGQSLLRALDAAGFDGTVVGADISEPAFHPEFCEFHWADLTRSESTALLEDVDAIVHLAYVLTPQKDSEREASVDAALFETVLEAVRQGRARKLCVASSATAYGAYADNPVPIGEEVPLRPNEGFVYATSKGEIEQRIADFRTERPDVVITVFRPAIVLGPNVDNYLAKNLFKFQPFGLEGPRPPMQFVHEDDVAAAWVHALEAGLDGAYNVAADGWMEADEYEALIRRRQPVLKLSPDMFTWVVDQMFRTGLLELPVSGIPYVRFPWVLSNSKMASVGFRPRHGNEQTVTETLRAIELDIRERRQELVARMKPALAATAAAALTAALLSRRGRRKA